MPSAEINRQNGRKSNGPKTAGGKQTCALAAVAHGIRAWSPVLPGETEADWAYLLNGCRESCQPVGVPEEELVYNIAVTFLQMHRLNRREREVSLECMRVDFFSPHEKDEVQERFRRPLTSEQQTDLERLYTGIQKRALKRAKQELESED